MSSILVWVQRWKQSTGMLELYGIRNTDFFSPLKYLAFFGCFFFLQVKGYIIGLSTTLSQCEYIKSVSDSIKLAQT